MHSRERRLSRSERLSAEPSWKLILPPLDFLLPLLLRDFFDPVSLFVLTPIARSATENVATCALPAIATEAAMASAALTQRLRIDVLMCQPLEVDAAHHLLHGHSLSGELRLGGFVALGGR